MKEWKDKFNSFNSDKGLTYTNWYEDIKYWKYWKDGLVKPLAPVEVSLDPILACQLKCNHCNAHKYLEEGKEKLRLDDELLMNTVSFLRTIGVKAICFGGGGEPTLHTKLPDAIRSCYYMQSSIATNGIVLNDDLLDAMKHCRWIGVSVDAATEETYEVGRRMNKFNQVLDNIEDMTTVNKDVCFKFLIFDYNQHEIFEACKLAKELGVSAFHARPADVNHQGLGEFRNTAKPFNVEKVLEQFEKCHELEDEKFKVFTVVHKFDKDFKPVKNFTQCYASPCCLQLCADGNAYLCPDQRYQEFYKLGSFNPPSNILNFWGSEKHYDLVFKTGKGACNTRCTFAPYNEQCERLFINQDDPMCRYFI